ncbi:hypothetical protein F2Q70_00021409 [Brassica cretica]|uniref:Uncharacterized protein n=2 Tax=Brassica cretica TaxID=69181 RepID=A0A3N6UPH9_BRACR|nr:hypothetical protein F2Q70_00021409 [Brassica cretica]KAF2557004.1 hypothetical protein F2Q68_00014955 [Brassica cretica]KAF3605845.1 hypothetical protein DY000_02047700 [Brassica cretica]
MNQLSPVASMEERWRNVDDEAEKLNGGGGRKASLGGRGREKSLEYWWRLPESSKEAEA